MGSFNLYSIISVWYEIVIIWGLKCECDSVGGIIVGLIRRIN